LARYVVFSKKIKIYNLATHLYHFFQSDPFVVLSRLSDSGAETVFHKTETIMKTLNPEWKTFEMPVSTFCNGDFDRKIEFKVLDWDSDGTSELIGVCTTSLTELLRPDRPLLEVFFF
jgi:Ca2+-dependent lipid-binding protein